MKKKVTTGVVIVSLLLIGRCGPPADDMRPAEQNMVSMSLPILLNGDASHTLVDHRDGTVSLVTYNQLGSVLRKSIYKKCLQGQVYRPLPNNDCQGAGSALNDWGAVKLAYCNANDNSCNTNGKYVWGPNSPLYLSCAGDATAGRKWYPVEFGEDWSHVIQSSLFSSMFTEYPQGTGIWTAGPSNISKQEARYFVYPLFSPLRRALKTTLLYAHCAGKFNIH